MKAIWGFCFFSFNKHPSGIIYTGIKWESDTKYEFLSVFYVNKQLLTGSLPDLMFIRYLYSANIPPNNLRISALNDPSSQLILMDILTFLLQ